MKIYYLFFIMFFVGLSLYGQNQQRVDSLESELIKFKDIQHKAEIYAELSAEYQTFDLAKALETAEKLKELAVKENNDILLDKSLRLIYNACVLAGDMEKTEQTLQDLQALYERTHNLQTRSAVLQGMARLYMEKTEYEQAIETFHQAIEVCQEGTKTDEVFEYHLSHIRLNYAITLMRWAYTKKQSGTLSKKEANTLKKNILDLMNKSLEYKKKENELGEVTLVYNNLAVVYQVFENKDSIMYYNEKALQLAQNNKDAFRTAMAYDNIAEIYHSEGNFDLALDYLNRSLKKYQDLGAQKWVGKVYSQRAKNYKWLEQYDKAIADLEKALDIYESTEDKHGIMTAASLLSESYEEQEDYKNALYYFQKYSEKHNEILSEQSLKDIAWVRAKYDSENREKQISELQISQLKNQKQIKNNLIIIISLISVILIIVMLLILLRMRNSNQRKKHEIEKQEMLSKLKEEELKSVIKILESKENTKQKIAHELHDRLGVMLATIKLYVESEKNKSENETSRNNLAKGLDLLQMSIDEVRAISRELSSPTLEKFGLNSAVNELVKSINQTKNLYISYEFSEDIKFDSQTKINVYRIIQELFSNAIRHSKADSIQLKLEAKGKNIILNYSDNGIGFSESEAQQGVGWKSIYSRINQLKGTVRFEPSGKGTNILFELPV